jgi:hypothetical protein
LAASAASIGAPAAAAIMSQRGPPSAQSAD